MSDSEQIALLRARVAELEAACVKMARCWTGNSFCTPSYYMAHGTNCGGQGNDRPCSCASNQSRSCFVNGRRAIEAVLPPP